MRYSRNRLPVVNIPYGFLEGLVVDFGSGIVLIYQADVHLLFGPINFDEK